MFRLRNPVFDDLVLRDIRAALAAGDRQHAAILACRALDDGLDDPLLFYLRSGESIRQNKHEEATNDLIRAATSPATGMKMRSMCAMELVGLNRIREAIAVLEDAVRLHPNLVSCHFRLGWVHEIAGHSQRALACYRKVLSLDDRHSGALTRLSGLALRSGDAQLARCYADRALAIDAKEYGVLCAKVNLALAENKPDEADIFVHRLLGLKDLPREDHSTALGLLGDVRHAQRRFADAFKAYAAGNAEKQDIFKAQFGRDDAESFSGYVGWLATCFESLSCAEARGAPGGAATSEPNLKDHAFIAGFPRSGTTLLENILAAHPEVSTLAEMNTMADSLRTFLSSETGRQRLAVISSAEARNAKDIYWRRVAEAGAAPDGKVFIDENPLSTPWLALVAKLFPRAKIIFAVRDPRDVVFSCFRRRLQMSVPTYEFVSLERAAKFYATTMHLAEIYRDKLGLPWIDVRHESLVADFEAEASRLCHFLGLSYDSAMRDFANRAQSRAITTFSAPQIVRGLNGDGIGVWRHYARELAPIMSILEPWVEKFGYPPN